MASDDDHRASGPPNLYSVTSSDSNSRLIDRSSMDPAVVDHIGELMAALARLREAEQHLSDASLKYMKLNQSDMRALHFLIVAKNRGIVATPGAIASHLKISTASTTKLLDRLQRSGHITRQAHPTDRRALAISITPATHEAAINTVGRQQANRFYAAARISPEERDVVIRFLDDMTEEISLTDQPWVQHDAAQADLTPQA